MNIEPELTTIWIIGQWEFILVSNVYWDGKFMPDEYYLVNLVGNWWHYMGHK